MKLELKAIRYNNLLSKQSHCFTASIYLNGKLAAHIESDGQGACPTISYADPTTRTFLLNHFKNLPKQKTVGDYGTYEYQPDLETWANEQVGLWLKKKSFKVGGRLGKTAIEHRVSD